MGFPIRPWGGFKMETQVSAIRQETRMPEHTMATRPVKMLILEIYPFRLPHSPF